MIMKTITISIALLIGSVAPINAQSGKSIASPEPAVQGLFATPKMINKLINLELIKLNTYQVYDEYDMAEAIVTNTGFQKDCFGLNCLSKLGNTLKVDYILSGSFDHFGNKIVISLKIVDVASNSIYKTAFKEFGNQEIELQRMIEILLHEMHGIPNPKETLDQLSFQNNVITSSNYNRIDNSGPRIGYAFLTGTLSEFATRPEDQGGMAINPMLSMIGYQFEKQYVGTENFSALFETVVNISGLEQSTFIPTIALLNGFRFGKSGWEFAFGPSFGLQKTSQGFFDTQNTYGKGHGHFWTKSEYLYTQSTLIGGTGAISDPAYSYSSILDNRGRLELSTRWVMGFGRTFKAGSLNLPVNFFYSSVKKGSMIGVSVGFNVLQKRENIAKH
jgi:hypothetical protein